MNTCNRLDLKIGVDGVSCTDFSIVGDKIFLVVGTCNGRVRLFDYMNRTNSLYQRRWHKTIRCLSFFPALPNLLVSASSQSGLKIHDMNSEKQIWACFQAHGKSPISSLLTLKHGQWVTGDEDGVIKMWDSRKSGCVSVMTPSEDCKFDDHFNAINDLAVSEDSHGTLLAAVDDGTLAVYNIRRRRFEMASETLGYSARTLCIVKSKVLVGTDEGVICVFNWNEFGNICDRFPVHPLRPSKHGQARTATAGVHSVEKIVKITDDIVAVATDDGVISALNILPNRLLGCIGYHMDTPDSDTGADCLTLSVCPVENIIASTLIIQAENETTELKLPKHQRQLDSTKLKGVKSRRLCLTDTSERMEYLEGLLPEKVNTSSIHSHDSSSEDEDSWNSEAE
ncbi:unnamed protein product [Heterobilharzia americana]|nr:unnamed protein product [Heterobilharzia americana]